jgi:uncharacterized lipoprotein NlpE involved in copper resistance
MTMKKYNNFLMMAFVLVALAACQVYSDEKDKVEPEVEEAPAVDTAAVPATNPGIAPGTKKAASQGAESTPTTFFGTYSGTIPCADCEGIETTLTLNDDKTFSITRKYLGKGDDKPFVSNGRWDWMSDNAIKLNEPGGAPTLIYVMEGKALMLDRSGNRVTGDLADKYYLFKAK